MAKLLLPAILVVLLTLAACTNPTPTAIVDPTPPAAPTETAAADSQTERTPVARPTQEPTALPTQASPSLTDPTATVVPTSTPYPTYTPEPTYTPAQVPPTSTPYPTYTPEPTYTLVPVLPTSTPYPTYTPEPTYTLVPVPPTSTPYPTLVPTPTATPVPTPTLAPPAVVDQTYTTTDGVEITVSSLTVSKTGNVTVVRVVSTVRNTTPDLRSGTYWRLHYREGGADTAGTISPQRLVPGEQYRVGWTFYVESPYVASSLTLVRWPERTQATDSTGVLNWDVSGLVSDNE